MRLLKEGQDSLPKTVLCDREAPALGAVRAALPSADRTKITTNLKSFKDLPNYIYPQKSISYVSLEEIATIGIEAM